MTQALPAPRRMTKVAATTARQATARQATARQATARQATARQATARQATARQATARQATARPATARQAASGTQARTRGPAPKRSEVLARCRPTPERAAAAAALFGAAAPAVHPDRRKQRAAHLKVVDDSKRAAARRRRRARLSLIMVVTLGFTVALALVYVHVVMAQRQFALDRLNTQVQQEQLRYQQLRFQVAQLGSPEQIIVKAESQGMVQPTNISYLTPTVTVPGTPTAGASPSSYSPLSGQAPAGDSDWPQIKSQLAGTS